MRTGKAFKGPNFDKQELTSTELLQLHNRLKEEENSICREFIDAVNNHDRDKIIAIADAVWFFRDKLPRKPAFFDRERWLLSLAKRVLDAEGVKWEIRQVAQFVSLSKDVETLADGFSALRRKCKEMKFPLAESRKGRRKTGA